MIKLDLHSHSVLSADGSLKESDYRRLLEENILDAIAITDHDQIEYALAMHKIFKDKIIIGQEISTKQGEIIGLFLDQLVKPDQDIKKTIADIKKQKGLVYIPHPFETVRSGITQQTIETIKNEVDIVEVNNGRAFFQNKGPQATTWARLNNKVVASSSDAHGPTGIGSCYTLIKRPPTKENLVDQLKMGRLCVDKPPLLSLLYPKYNRIRAKLKISK